MNWHLVLIKALTATLKSVFEDGFLADKVLERAFKNNKKWGKRDRQFLAETTYDMVRWWRRLAAYDKQAWIPKDYMLRWAFFEAWKNGADAVQFLESKKIDLGMSFDQIKEQVEKSPLSPREQVSFPDWLFEKIEKEYGTEAVGLMTKLNDPAPVYLRVNFLKASWSQARIRLKEEGVDAIAASDVETALKLTARKNVFVTPSFKDGFFEVQDLASQRIAPFLQPQPGERVADACAGAGGKTLHLAALMKNKGTLLASDISPKKLEQLKLRARRAGVSNLRIQLVESSKDIKKHYQAFDAVLIDAPCSGSGVLRRNPDSKWKLTEKNFSELLETQKNVLEDYSKWVKPGGRLVYATCSLLSEENQKQVEAFLKAHPEFELKDSFHRRPDWEDEDGFYAALLWSRK